MLLSVETEFVMFQMAQVVTSGVGTLLSNLHSAATICRLARRAVGAEGGMGEGPYLAGTEVVGQKSPLLLCVSHASASVHLKLRRREF
jgi:hypothetical protein